MALQRGRERPALCGRRRNSSFPPHLPQTLNLPDENHNYKKQGTDANYQRCELSGSEEAAPGGGEGGRLLARRSGGNLLGEGFHTAL